MIWLLLILALAAAVAAAAWGHHSRLAGYRATRRRLAAKEALIAEVRMEVNTAIQLNGDPLASVLSDIIARHESQEINQ